MSKKTKPENSEKELTPEQLKKMRLDMISYYKNQNEILVLQSEFEKHQADIAENRVRAYGNQIRLASMMQGPTPEKEVKQERKLQGQA
jgi:hypothetical protein